jgi:hypothetical protein
VWLEGETIWLTQKQMAELFGVKEHTITYHHKGNRSLRRVGRNGNYSKNSSSSIRGR